MSKDTPRLSDEARTHALQAARAMRTRKAIAPDAGLIRPSPAFETLAGYKERQVLLQAAGMLDIPDPYFRLHEGRAGALTPLLAQARQVPQTLVLRDYHVDNLMLLPGTQPGGGPQGLGLLDFQDAVIGPVTYDLVSLLEDARRDVSPALAAAMLARYAAAFPEIDPAALDLSCRIMGAQRSMKIVGIFTRLSRRDGKHRYLTHIPRLWRLIARDLDHPALAPLSAWLDAAIPPAIRTTPETPA